MCFSCAWLMDLTAVKLLNVVNVFIVLFGLVMIGLASWAIAVLGDDAFFSTETYVMMLLFGLMTLLVAFLACIGDKSPKEHPNYLFCYWLIISMLLIGNATGFYLFKVFNDGINSTGDGSDVSSVLETTAAKEIQDFILSTYTTCCTGCDASIEELGCEVDIVASDITGEAFCSESFLFNGTDIDEGECLFAEICSAEVLEAEGVSNGIGLGCYTSASEIPNFEVGVDTCNVFAELEVNDKPIVGNAANGVSCGGGDPVVHVNNVRDYFNDRYLLIAIPLGFLMSFLGLAWGASLFMILFYTSGRNPYLS